MDEVLYNRKAIIVFTLKEGEGTDFILLFAAVPQQFDMFKELITSRPKCMLRLKVWRNTLRPNFYFVRKISALWTAPVRIKMILYLEDGTEYVVNSSNADVTLALTASLKDNAPTTQIRREVTEMLRKKYQPHDLLL